MKKKFLNIIYFTLLLIVTLVMMFEVTFRILSPDMVISLLGKLSFIGIEPSFNSLFILMVIASLLIAIIIYSFFYKMFNRKKDERIR